MLNEDHNIDGGQAPGVHPSYTAFRVLKNGEHAPRNLCIDTDPSSIWDLRKNDRVLSTKWNDAHGVESSGGLYPRGMLSPVADLARNKTRFLLEESDHPSGVVFFYGCGGGTGSGLTTNVSARLFCDNPKLKQVHFVVSPNPGMRALPTSPVESYNFGLMANDMLDMTNCNIMVDNDALYHICAKKARFIKPNYSYVNKLMSMAVLVASSGWRLISSPSVKFEDMPTNLVISPLMKYSVMSLAPIFSYDVYEYDLQTTGDITRELFQPNSYLARCDPQGGAIAACISYRGEGVSAVSVSTALGEQTVRGGAKFVSWMNPSFKVGITPVPLPCMFGMKLPVSACMLSNTRGLAPHFGEIHHNFSSMLSRKAFIHWYLNEGMEFNEFEESLQNLNSILNKYMRR
ncbi:tubulin alpha-8 chain isoform X2 [Halyomorpha halys]|nr:tubulin alpha chain-like isoform X2 [Halyomorpha halys]